MEPQTWMGSSERGYLNVQWAWERRSIASLIKASLNKITVKFIARKMSKRRKTDSTKYWQTYEKTAILVHRWWDHKLAQTFENWHIPLTLNLQRLCDPVAPLLGTYLRQFLTYCLSATTLLDCSVPMDLGALNIFFLCLLVRRCRRESFASWLQRAHSPASATCVSSI